MPRKTTPPTGPTHNGRLIVGQLLELRQAGGAFSKQIVATNPELLDGVKQGDELTLAVRVACVDEHFPIQKRDSPNEGGIYHKFVFDTVETAVVDPSVVEGSLATQRELIQKLKDEAEGNETIDSQIAEQHAAGEHAELVDGCVDCEKEAALADAKAAAARDA